MVDRQTNEGEPKCMSQHGIVPCSSLHTKGDEAKGHMRLILQTWGRADNAWHST